MSTRNVRDERCLAHWGPEGSDPSSLELQQTCVHHLIEAQVQRAPAVSAVHFEGRELTYKELDARAKQLAHHLIRRGAGPNVLVGICLERSLDPLVALLAVQKAGSGYVPLDPDHPKARLTYILEDTRVGLIITEERLVAELSPYSRVVLCLDELADHAEPASSPCAALSPDDLAYVTYTSGSTDRPKGVVNTQRGVLNYLSCLTRTFHLNASDVVLQLASLSFDASTRDTLGPLTVGAKVVLVKNSDARDPAALLAKIKEERATCLLSVVPTVLNALLDAVVPEEVPYDSIRLVLASGESLHLATCRRARAVFGPGALLVNQYGPSECTMTCTYHAVHELESHRDVALIGRPIQNTQIFVLGSDLRPAPVGASGEIHIGGQGLTLGYMNQPESTAENFVPNPFSEEPGARLYKTGDLARYLADGNLEFLGRIDHQVKIGGVRIEPGEIECVLRRHESLTDCAVVVRTLSNRGRNLIAKQSAEFTVHAAELQRLVAYIVCRNPSSTVDWRRYLEAELPPYMVPARFIELDALPMNANGKLDRRALPDPEQVRPKLEHPYASPRSSSESLVARLWQDTLDLDRVGVHDGFFELGGDSLMAMQVLNRLRHATGVDLGFQQQLSPKTSAVSPRESEQEG